MLQTYKQNNFGNKDIIKEKLRASRKEAKFSTMQNLFSCIFQRKIVDGTETI